MKGKYHLIQHTKPAKQVGAYIILSGNGRHIATIHLFYSRVEKLRMDVYEKDILVHQYEGVAEEAPFFSYFGKREDYPFSRALHGLKLDGVTLFMEGTGITQEEPGIAGKENKSYLPGLDRMKALGYQVIKAI